MYALIFHVYMIDIKEPTVNHESVCKTGFKTQSHTNPQNLTNVSRITKKIENYKELPCLERNSDSQCNYLVISNTFARLILRSIPQNVQGQILLC